jgi:hypothetical protein
VVLRVAEGMGLGMLGGCGAALPLVIILLWRGMPAMGIAVAALIIGAAAGVLRGIIVRPTAIAAAMEADRQLGWADLLSSAMMVRSNAPSDPWAGAVRAEADARCRGVSPSTVVLHRLGARAWGGIGLVAALVLAMGIVPTFVAPAMADQQNAPRNPLDAIAEGPKAQPSPGGAVAHRTHTQEEPEDDRASRMNGVEQPPPPTAGQRDASADADRQRPNDAADPNGRGTGASQSKSANSANHLVAASGTQARPPTGGTHAAAGSGQAFSQAPNGVDASGESAGRSDSSRSVPPWATSNWAADSQRANAAVESGRIPDAYRDVIRGYFESN